MQQSKRNKLERNGWRVGGAVGFLGLGPEESALVEMKVSLARAIRTRRARRKLTQAQFAELIGSSQSRVAKMEAADMTVSLELLVRSLLALGASRGDVARAIATRTRVVA